MKDKGGHGSDARGGGSSSPDVKANIQKAARLAKTLGADHPSVGAALHDAVMAARPAGGFYKIGGGQPVESNAHAAATLASGPKSAPVDTHPAMASADKRVTIFHQDGEYAVPSGGKGHYFTNDKQDAEDTARSIHGRGISITHRAKSWGPEMD